MNPRVCFLPSDLDGPGGYRCLLPAEELVRHGWKAGIPEFTAYKKPDGRLHFDINGFHWNPPTPNADIYVIHCRGDALLPKVVPLLQTQGKIVVASTDDNNLHLPAWHPSASAQQAQARKNWHEVVRRADALLVSTPHLAGVYKRLNPNVWVIPNYLHWPMWENVKLVYQERLNQVKPRKLRIGWRGSPKLRDGDLALLKPWLAKWLERNPEVFFVSSGGDVHDQLGIPKAQRRTYGGVDFYTGQLPSITAVMDIALIPLASCSFNEGKSCLTGMEMNACGIPILASPTAAYRDWAGDRRNGLLCTSPQEWTDALDQLVADGDLRRRMAVAARAKAREHSLDKHIGEWEDFLHEVSRDRLLFVEARKRGAVQISSEFVSFLKHLRETFPEGPRTVVELGTAVGGTFYALCRAAHPEALLVSMDMGLKDGVFADGFEYGVDEIKGDDLARLASYGKEGQTIKFVRGDSHSAVTKAELESALAGRQIDLLFIDGDHSYEGVSQDFQDYAPLVSGLIAFHDIGKHPKEVSCHVKRFWDENKRRYRHREFVAGLHWGGIGVLHLEAGGAGEHQPQPALRAA